MAKTRKEIEHKYNLKVFLGFLKKYKGLFIATIIVILIAEALSISDKFLFKVIVDKGTEYSSGLLILDKFINILLIVAAIFIAIALMKALNKLILLHFINKLESNLMMDLKQRYFNHIVSLSHSFHVNHKTGSLIARLSRGSSAIERMTDFIVFNTAPLVFQVILIGLSLIYFDWLLAVIVILTVIVFIAYSLIIQSKQHKSNRKLNEKEDIEKANVSDVFTNIDSIKYFGKENRIKNRFANISNNTRKALMEFWGHFKWLDAGQSLILSIGTFFIIYIPIRGFLNNEVTLGTIVFIYTVYGPIFNYLFGFMHGIRNYYRAIADFDDLFQYGKIEQEVKDIPRARELKITKGKIEFRDVSFKYHTRNILSLFNLKIEPGEKVALVGHSGSGKSTIIKLLYRFYNLQKGAILIDGKDIREFKQEPLRSELSIVPQECVLFDDTVYNNILFSRPNAARKEVVKAMKFAQLDKVVKSFPDKENTIVGERGVKLSGGEKQRVSIARAILADKKVIVLDEATSSLDSQTEHDIQKDLKQLLEGRTAIIIAHRLSTIMNADRIIVLEKGKIIQLGTHNQLLKEGGLYKHLWSLQKGGYIHE